MKFSVSTMKNRINQLFSSGLRASTLLSRFLLTIFLARYVSTEELGLFSLYWAGITLAASIMGLDVYSYTTRSLLKPTTNKTKILSLHIGFLIISGIFLIPVSGVLFYINAQQAPLFLVFVFVFHLPFEFYSQEVSRLLVPLNKPLVSNIILFVRTAIWIPVAIVALVYNWNSDPIQMTILVWVVGSITSAVLSFLYINIAAKVVVTPLIKFSWIKTSLIASGIFLVSTVIFRIILGGDRFFVSNILGVNILGVYTVYASVSLGVLGLLESGISAWKYPKLITAIQSNQPQKARKLLWSFWVENLVSSFILMIIVVLLFNYLANIYLDEIYTRNIMGFYLISSGVFLYSVSMPFHYYIFGLKKDKILVLVYLTSLISMLTWSVFFMAEYGVIGAGMMLALALTVIALLRSIYVIRYVYYD